LLAVTDHFVPSLAHSPRFAPYVREAIDILQQECVTQNIDFLGPDHPDQGIVHVIAPESGFTLPGTFIVCIDSHTSTNGALGAVGFGIGTTDMTHVLATQCLWQRKPKTMRIAIEGRLPDQISAKDVALAVIGQIGTAGGTGYAIEFAGSAVRAMSMDARMTLCNLAIEAGARVGLIAPDETTIAWLEGRRFTPKGEAWERAVADWRTMVSDPDAIFDHEVVLDVSNLAPQVTWGTSPEDVVAVTAAVPVNKTLGDPELGTLFERKLDYMDVAAGAEIAGLAIDRVFIGSCTNSRIEDLRAAASIVKGRRAVIPGLVVPGSQATRKQAEAEGLDRIFTEAGFIWGAPGCSMCTALNGEGAKAGERVASTSNRNFEGRQGRGARTHLMSPTMAAAAAITGKITDVRLLRSDRGSL
jgi:3-isopropylmalate/(R)-2-methylmalate dehydratase large subunit